MEQFRKIKWSEVAQKTKIFISVNKKVLGILAAASIAATSGYYIYKKIQQSREQKKKEDNDSSYKKANYSENPIDGNNSLTNKDWFINYQGQSLSNSEHVSCIHYDIVLDVNVQKKILNTSINYHFIVLKETNEILLDMENQQILYCVVDGCRLDYEVKKNPNSDNSNRNQLRVELPGYASVGGCIELTVNTLATSFHNENIQWIDDLKNPQNNIFISQGTGNYAIFPCQDDPTLKSTFNICMSIFEPSTAFSTGNNLANFKNVQQSYAVYEQKNKISVHMVPIIAGNFEEIKGERVTIIQRKGDHPINKLQQQIQLIKHYKDIDEDLKQLNKNEIETRVFILPREANLQCQYAQSISGIQFIPESFTHDNFLMEEIIIRGIIMNKLAEYLEYGNSDILQINLAIISFFVSRAYQSTQQNKKTEQQTENHHERESNLFRSQTFALNKSINPLELKKQQSLSRSQSFFDDITKYSKSEKIMNFIISFLQQEKKNCKNLKDFLRLIQQKLGKNTTNHIKIEDYFDSQNINLNA